MKSDGKTNTPEGGIRGEGKCISMRNAALSRISGKRNRSALAEHVEILNEVERDLTSPVLNERR